MRFFLGFAMAMAIGLFTGITDTSAAAIKGTWAGGGTVKLNTGQVERVRCRIRYEESSGRTFVIYANCSHANGTFQQSGRIVKRSSTSYSGSLYSDQYSISGDLLISVSGNRQTISAKSSKGSAKIVLTKQ
jgi:hypothetical protein